MATAKDLKIAPISAQTAKGGVLRWHYSGKVVNNSKLHFGAFLNNQLVGVMSFGSPMDKSKVLGLVKDTKWNGMLELNRMAFSDIAPPMSESRSLAIAFKLIKKNYPFIEWVLSFADGCQCGDGTIYRASGFVLTQIKENTTILKAPDGRCFAALVLTQPSYKITQELAKEYNITLHGASIKPFLDAGFKPLEGYMLRYIYFLNPKAKERLTVPIIPFSKIEEMGAKMYKGKRPTD